MPKKRNRYNLEKWPISRDTAPSKLSAILRRADWLLGKIAKSKARREHPHTREEEELQAIGLVLGSISLIENQIEPERYLELIEYSKSPDTPPRPERAMLVSGRHGAEAIKMLERRVNYLHERIVNGHNSKGLHYDTAETEAHKWAIDWMLKMEFFVKTGEFYTPENGERLIAGLAEMYGERRGF